MVGLGNYSISPALFGAGIIVSHTSDKSLSREYDCEAVFRVELQRRDWQALMMALVNLLAMCNKLLFAGYLRNGSHGVARMAIKSATIYMQELPKDTPIIQQEKIKFIIDTFPRFVSGNRPLYDKPITESLQTIQEYYDRYLQKWETYNNPELTA